MNGQDRGSGGLYRVNYPGIGAGIAMMILPFLDAWWFFALAEAVVIAVSPFQVTILSFGSEVASPLISSLNIALKIVMVYYGGLLVAGSLLRVRDDRRSLADWLVRISARKLLWLVVLFAASVAVSDFIINQSFALMGIGAQVPYFTGAALVPLKSGGVSVTLPVLQGFTDAFFIAVLVAILSLIAYFYQGRVELVKTERGLRPRLVSRVSLPGTAGKEVP